MSQITDLGKISELGSINALELDMPLDRRELAQRISQTGPSDGVRGALFHAVIDSLREHHPEARGLARLEARCGRAAMQELHFYPVADWLELFWDAADALELKAGGLEPAIAQLGDGIYRRFLGSISGSLAAAAGSGKPPIERLLGAPAAYGAGASYGSRTVERLGENLLRLRFEREFCPPQLHAAFVRSAATRLGHQVEIRQTVTGLLEFELEVEWK